MSTPETPSAAGIAAQAAACVGMPMRAIDPWPALGAVASPLFVGESCAVYRHRLHASHPDRGARITAQSPLVAFPRTAFGLSLSSGPRFVADRNTIVLLNAGDSLAWQPLVGEWADSDLLVVTPGALRSALESARTPVRRDSGGVSFPTHSVLSTPRLYLAMRRLVSTLAGGGPDPAVEPQLLDLLAEVVRLCPGRADEGRRPCETTRSVIAVRRARALLAARAGAPLSLDEVAAQVHMSPYHLSRVFKRHCGTSIHAYWLRLTMAHALSLLRDPSLSVSGVANRLGFCAHSHFSSTFRRHFGITPRSYVRTLRQSCA